MTLEQARLEARVWDRAQRLADSGYRLEFLTEDVAEVTGPNGGPYRLDLMERTCECPFFADHGYCKHLWGWPFLERRRACAS
jgi:SWIM zinc finger.